VTTEGSESSAAALLQLQQEVGQLRTSLRQSSQEVELLRAQRQQLLEQQQQNARTIEQLQHRLQCLLRRFYGQSAERIDPKQMLLFKELLESACGGPTPPRPAAPESATTDPPARKGHGRRRLPADLPRRTIIHDLPEEEKCCPHCGERRQIIGREVTEQIDYVPPQISVLEHQQLKYGCRHCEQDAVESGPQITTAEKPLSPIEKGLAAPGLLAYVIGEQVRRPLAAVPAGAHPRSLRDQHLPLDDGRVDGPVRRGLASPVRSPGALCGAISRDLHGRHPGGRLGSRARSHPDRSVLGVCGGCAASVHGVHLYANRSRDGPRQFLQGWSGYLQADAFGGYDGIYAGDAGGRVIEVACWAHARRYCYEARKTDAAGSTQALAYVRLLYDVEDEAKRQFASQDEGKRPVNSVRHEGRAAGHHEVGRGGRDVSRGFSPPA